nr:YndJ family transporter [Shimazuella soli]
MVSGFGRFLFFSIFLFIPASLALVPTIKRMSGESSRYHTLLSKYHLYFAIIMGAALLFPIGSAFCEILSIVWLIYSFALFGYGIRRLVERGYYVMEENAVDTSFLYAFIGGITLTMYCFSSHPSITYLYQAATFHFQFTAVLSTLFIGWTGRILLIDKKLCLLYRGAVIGLIVSPLLIGIGMLSNSWLQNIGLWIYTLCMIAYGYFILFHTEKKNFIATLCIQLSAIILIATSILSVINGIYQLQGLTWIRTNSWVYYYQIPIVFGFALGLIGWYYRKPLERRNLYQLPQININGTWFIGKNFLKENGYEEEIVSHAGILTKLERYRRSDLMIDQLHPKVISFMENTSLYDISLHAHWTKGAWLFEKLHKALSNKIQQANIPSPGEGIRKLDSKIISINNHHQYWNRKLNAWICSYQDSDETFIAGIYSEHEYDGERYVHFTMPVPNCNRATFYRLEHGINGSLQCTSVPRRGGDGDEGHYLMTKNFSFRIPFNENLIIWVDDYGRLQMTHRFWFFGVKVLNLEYEMIAK